MSNIDPPPSHPKANQKITTQKTDKMSNRDTPKKPHTTQLINKMSNIDTHPKKTNTDN
jgi:hypothetical protein